MIWIYIKTCFYIITNVIDPKLLIWLKCDILIIPGENNDYYTVNIIVFINKTINISIKKLFDKIKIEIIKLFPKSRIKYIILFDD